MKFILKFFILFLSGSTFAQEISYGVKAGTNIVNGASITGISHFENDELVYWNGTAKAKGKMSYHAGAFFEMDYGDFFLRPEVNYSNLRSEFIIPFKTASYEVKQLEVPVLLGYNIPSLFGLYAGPSFSKVIKNYLEDKEEKIFEDGQEKLIFGSSVENEGFPIAIQVGLNFSVQRIGLDLRYQHTLRKVDSQKIDMLNQPVGRQIGGINEAIITPDLNQFVISMTYKIGIPGSQKTYGRHLGYRN